MCLTAVSKQNLFTMHVYVYAYVHTHTHFSNSLLPPSVYIWKRIAPKDGYSSLQKRPFEKLIFLVLMSIFNWGDNGELWVEIAANVALTDVPGCRFPQHQDARSQLNRETLKWQRWADQAPEARSLAISFTCHGTNALPFLQQPSSGFGSHVWARRWFPEAARAAWEKALQNYATRIKWWPMISTPSSSHSLLPSRASTQSLAAVWRAICLLWVELYFQEVSMAQEAPTRS